MESGQRESMEKLHIQEDPLDDGENADKIISGGTNLGVQGIEVPISGSLGGKEGHKSFYELHETKSRFDFKQK